MLPSLRDSNSSQPRTFSASALRFVLPAALLAVWFATAPTPAVAAVEDHSELSQNLQQLIDVVRATAGRKQEIVSQQPLPQDAVPTTNPRAGRPIRVVHIDPDARPGGNGTIERPFQSINDFQDLSDSAQASYDIIYIHGSGGIHVLDEPLQLAPWQQLLSSSVPHGINTSGGLFDLPGFNPLHAPPTLMSNTGNVIHLSHNNVVSGFFIDAGRFNTGSAIAGDGISGFNINRNEFRNGINGVSIVSGGASLNSIGNLSDNSFDNFLNDAFQLTHVGPGLLDLTIQNNTAINNGGIGFNITADGAPMNLNVIGNTATNNSSGFILNANNGAVVNGTFRDNRFSDSTGIPSRVTIRRGAIAF